MKRFYIVLAVVALLGILVYPFAVLVTDTLPAQFEEHAEDIESYPGTDAEWYAVGFMPVLLIGVPLAVAVAVVVFAARWARLRP